MPSMPWEQTSTPFARQERRMREMSIRPRTVTMESLPSKGNSVTPFPADCAARETAERRTTTTTLAAFTNLEFIALLRKLDPAIGTADAEGLREIRSRKVDGTTEALGDLREVAQAPSPEDEDLHGGIPFHLGGNRDPGGITHRDEVEDPSLHASAFLRRHFGCTGGLPYAGRESGVVRLTQIHGGLWILDLESARHPGLEAFVGALHAREIERHGLSRTPVPRVAEDRVLRLRAGGR